MIIVQTQGSCKIIVQTQRSCETNIVIVVQTKDRTILIRSCNIVQTKGSCDFNLISTGKDIFFLSFHKYAKFDKIYGAVQEL